jgi:hypothetical protein
LALLGLSGIGGCGNTEPYARAFEIGDLTETIGGPKAVARPGDYILENDRIRLAILDARVSPGPHTSGGSIVDADLQRLDPRYLHGKGNDRLSEVFATVNLNVQEADEDAGTVQIINDGSDGGAAIICTTGPEKSFLTLLDALWTFQWAGERPYFAMRTDYILEPGMGAVKIRTVAVVGAEAPCDVVIEAEAAITSNDTLPLINVALDKNIEADEDTEASGLGGLAFGDFYLQGGSVDVFTPGVGFDEESYVSELLVSGVNTATNPIALPYIAGTADGVSYALLPNEGLLFIPMFTSSQTVAIGAATPGVGRERFPAGTALFYERWFGVGAGDVGSALDAVLEARGDKVGRITGQVVEEGTGVAVPGAHVLIFKPGDEAPFSEFETDVGIDDRRVDGSFGGTLPVGDWELLVHAEGRPDGTRSAFTVEEDGEVTAVLASPRPGSVHFTVVDETGIKVPSKVTFFTAKGESPRNPVYGDHYIAGAPAALQFTADGEGDIILPPGEYYAVASRGIEYELGTTDTFKVTATSHIELDLQVARSVDSTGWVSADFHVHAYRSFDSGVNNDMRVTTMAAEGVEYLSSNDHDALTDYAPNIHALGLEPWLGTVVGTEVTTLELGHFLGFPLNLDYLQQSGGSLDWTGLKPQEIIDGLRDLGDPAGVDPIVFIGHPRDGVLGYFDQYGFDPNSSTSGGMTLEDSLIVTASGNTLLARDNFSEDYDAIELLNGKRFEIVRTPTQPELDTFAADGDIGITYDMLARTQAEQDELSAGTYRLGYGHQGQIDDWFTLLNLGYTYTALGNSDTHGTTSIEAGCPRNYVMTDGDEPALLADDDVATAIREHRVFTTYGPFLRFYAGDESHGIGTTVQGGSVTFTVEVEAPTWMAVDRVELYENGTLIQEWTDLSSDDVVRLQTETTVTPSKDSWYVIIALGDDDLSPVFTAVDVAPIQLQDIVTDALSGVGLDAFLDPIIPIPRTFPVYPYALTNPIWVDVDSDGTFSPPGLPSWLQPPVEP